MFLAKLGAVFLTKLGAMTMLAKLGAVYAALHRCYDYADQKLGAVFLAKQVAKPSVLESSGCASTLCIDCNHHKYLL